MMRIIVTIKLVSCVVDVNTTSCSAKTDVNVNNCSCKFLHEETSDFAFTKSEILAAKVGLLSPLVLGGSAFGIWKYFKFKKSGPQFERAPSNVTDDNFDDRKNRKPFNTNGKISPNRRDSVDSFARSPNRRGSQDSYARPYSNPLSLSGDSEYSFDEARLDTPMHNMSETRWSPTSRAPPPAKSDAMNGWML